MSINLMSTLHTNDAIGSAMRLIDMGAEPYLVASSLQGVLAQRLIRRICPNCQTEYHPTEQERIWLSSLSSKEDDSHATYHYGSGCYQCSNTGYQGRIGVYEWLEMDPACLTALRNADNEAFQKAAENNKYYEPLEKCALDYAKQGLTTLEEVFRISASLSDQEPEMELDLDLDAELK